MAPWTVTDIFNSELRESISLSGKEFFAQGGFDTQAVLAEQDRTRAPRFLKDRTFQDRREIRLGVKFFF